MRRRRDASLGAPAEAPSPVGAAVLGLGYGGWEEDGFIRRAMYDEEVMLGKPAWTIES